MSVRQGLAERLRTVLGHNPVTSQSHSRRDDGSVSHASQSGAPKSKAESYVSDSLSASQHYLKTGTIEPVLQRNLGLKTPQRLPPPGRNRSPSISSSHPYETVKSSSASSAVISPALGRRIREQLFPTASNDRASQVKHERKASNPEPSIPTQIRVRIPIAGSSSVEIPTTHAHFPTSPQSRREADIGHSRPAPGLSVSELDSSPITNQRVSRIKEHSKSSYAEDEVYESGNTILPPFKVRDKTLQTQYPQPTPREQALSQSVTELQNRVGFLARALKGQLRNGSHGHDAARSLRSRRHGRSSRRRRHKYAEDVSSTDSDFSDSQSESLSSSSKSSESDISSDSDSGSDYDRSVRRENAKQREMEKAVDKILTITQRVTQNKQSSIPSMSENQDGNTSYKSHRHRGRSRTSRSRSRSSSRPRDHANGTKHDPSHITTSQRVVKGVERLARQLERSRSRSRSHSREPTRRSVSAPKSRGSLEDMSQDPLPRDSLRRRLLPGLIEASEPEIDSADVTPIDYSRATPEYTSNRYSSAATRSPNGAEIAAEAAAQARNSVDAGLKRAQVLEGRLLNAEVRASDLESQLAVAVRDLQKAQEAVVQRDDELTRLKIRLEAAIHDNDQIKQEKSRLVVALKALDPADIANFAATRHAEEIKSAQAELAANRVEAKQAALMLRETEERLAKQEQLLSGKEIELAAMAQALSDRESQLNRQSSEFEVQMATEHHKAGAQLQSFEAFKTHIQSSIHEINQILLSQFEPLALQQVVELAAPKIEHERAQGLYDRFGEENKDLQTELSTFKALCEAMCVVRQKEHTSVQEMSVALSRASQELDSSKSQLALALSDLEQTKNALALLRQQLNISEEQSRRSSGALETHEATLAVKDAELLAKVSQLDVLQGELQTKSWQLSELSRNLEAKSSELQTVSAQLQAKSIELDAKSAELQSKLSEIDTLTAELSTAREQLCHASSELEAKSTELAMAQLEITTKSSHLVAAAAEISSLKEDLATMTSQYEEATSQLNSLVSGNTTFQSDLTSMYTQLAMVQTELDTKSNDLQNMSNELSTKISELAMMTADIESRENELTSLRAEKDQLLGDIAAKESELTSKEHEIASMHRELAVKNEELAAMSVELGSKTEALASKEQELTSITAHLEGMNSGLPQLQLELNNKNEELELKNIQIDRVTTELEQKTAEMTSLKAKLDAKTLELELRLMDTNAQTQALTQKNAEILELEAELAMLRAKYDTLERAYAELRETYTADHESLQSQDTQMQLREAELSHYLSNALDDIAAREKRITELDTCLHDAISELEKSTRMCDEQSQAITILQQEKQLLSQQCGTLHNEVLQLKDQLKAQTNLQTIPIAEEDLDASTVSSLGDVVSSTFFENYRRDSKAMLGIEDFPELAREASSKPEQTAVPEQDVSTLSLSGNLPQLPTPSVNTSVESVDPEYLRKRLAIYEARCQKLSDAIKRARATISIAKSTLLEFQQDVRTHQAEVKERELQAQLSGQEAARTIDDLVRYCASLQKERALLQMQLDNLIPDDVLPTM